MEDKEKCILEKCDIFDFMAQHVGLSVLHPGGFEATSRLAEGCRINNNTKLIDIACGKGTTAIYLARKYGCKVIGVDISETLINEAKNFAKRKGVNDKVSFQVADALNLPFSDNEFDAAVSQAMLILVEDKKKAVQEAVRVIKLGGYAGWIELSWKKEPTKEFLDKVSNEICAYCMLNVHTFDNWKNLFSETKIKHLETIPFGMDFGGMRGMISDEGFSKSLKVMLKYMVNSRIRKRMNSLNKFFESYPEYFGYGIYILTK